MIFSSGLKESDFVQNFIMELSNKLQNNTQNNLEYENKEIPIIDNILSENKLTTGNANSIRWKLGDVILEYSNENFNNNSMYFIKDNKKTYWLNNKENYNNDVYTVLRVENNKIEEIEINKDDIKKDIGVNDVFTIENNEYVIDNNATKEIQEKITNMSKEIIDKQNMNLEKHRKEGHFYMVSEELGNNRFLKDLTDDAKVEFEEVSIPSDLLEKATEGAVLKFINGNYEFFSNDGFEKVE